MIKQVMRWWTMAGFFSFLLSYAQLTMPVGIVRDDLVEWSASRAIQSKW